MFRDLNDQCRHLKFAEANNNNQNQKKIISSCLMTDKHNGTDFRFLKTKLFFGKKKNLM